MTEIKEARACWSEGGQIFYCDGLAYGLSPKLRTICIGSEADILKAFKEHKSMGNPIIDNILTMDINNRGKSPQTRTRRHRMAFKGH